MRYMSEEQVSLTLEQIVEQAKADLVLLEQMLSELNPQPESLVEYKAKCVAKIDELEKTIEHNNAYELMQQQRKAEREAMAAQILQDIGEDLAPKVQNYLDKYGFI